MCLGCRRGTLQREIKTLNIYQDLMNTRKSWSLARTVGRTQIIGNAIFINFTALFQFSSWNKMYKLDNLYDDLKKK